MYAVPGIAHQLARAGEPRQRAHLRRRAWRRSPARRRARPARRRCTVCIAAGALAIASSSARSSRTEPRDHVRHFVLIVQKGRRLRAERKRHSLQPELIALRPARARRSAVGARAATGTCCSAMPRAQLILLRRFARAPDRAAPRAPHRAPRPRVRSPARRQRASLRASRRSSSPVARLTGTSVGATTTQATPNASTAI